MKTTILYSLLAGLFFMGHSAHAALLVNGELTHEYQTTSGQYLNGMLEVHNVGNQPQQVLITQNDRAPNGQAQPHQRSNRSWLQLAENQLVLQPGAKQQIAYTVAIPQGVQPGTYWSTISVEPLKGEVQAQQYQQPGIVQFKVKRRMRYTINVMTHLGRGNAEIAFQAPKITQNASGIKSLQLGLTNNGQFHGTPKVSVEVFDAQGNTLGTFAGNQRGLYPLVSKQFEIPLQNLNPGQYKALILAQDIESGRVFGADMNLTIKP